MQYEYGYPLLFARLLFDDTNFASSLSLVRQHYVIVLKYEKFAHTNEDVRSFLAHISMLNNMSVRTSWILWSNTGDNELSFTAQDERARATNDARFGGLGDTYINECCNAILRSHEHAQRDHANPKGTSPKSTCVNKQHQLITSCHSEARKVPVVKPDFAQTTVGSVKDADKHTPPVGILPHSWMTIMAPSLKEFHNPTPESVRAEVAAWMWLLEYESAYSALPPERRPALGDGWLATLCVSGMLIQHVESKKVYLSLGNETWVILLVPLVILRNNLCGLPARITLEFHFVHDLVEWVCFQTQCLTPAMCKKSFALDAHGISWQVIGPARSLLQGASQSMQVELNVEDLTNLLRMCRCGIPSPPRKGDLLFKLLIHVFPDWTDEERRQLWAAILQKPSEKKNHEADIDEDTRSCLREHLPPNQHGDFKMYEEALDRLDRNDRMARKRKHVDGNQPHLPSNGALSTFGSGRQ